MSLSNCIKKAGKAISTKDADEIQSTYDELVAKGVDESEAEGLALKSLEDSIDSEIDDILTQAGISTEARTTEGIPVEIDGKVYDSNELIDSIDKEIAGIDAVIRCRLG